WIVTNRKESDRRGKIQLIDATGFFTKMRKSLGNKRHEIGDGRDGKPDHIAEITRLYGDFTDGEHVRIFDNADFGYQRITVERPLRLNFVVSDERLARVREAKQFVNLATSKKRKDQEKARAEIAEGAKMQQSILDALDTISSRGVIKNRDEFTKLLRDAFKDSGVKVAPPLFKAILMALSERDETAEICTDKKGTPEPDSELRDYENVPLTEEIAEYMDREVLPHVPDAWVDGSKTRVGYEINFNRYFYKYTPPRPLEEIEADLKGIEKEISGMLEEMEVVSHP
ncbi:MAG: SAM-dependent DNA methyltransferase, partial [Methanosarcinales archaeon]|nr:SAM-dependent DNA methyltransferase [Methanosarcinales archaeon]